MLKSKKYSYTDVIENGFNLTKDLTIMPQTQRLNDELNVGDFISASHLTNSISFFRNFGESKEDY